MEWDTLEHPEIHHTNDWYASVIIIAGALIAVSFLYKNFLFVTLIFVGTFALLLLAARKPQMMHVDIRKTGVREGNILHPYQSLDGFSVIEYHDGHRLLLESNRRLMPLIVISVPSTINADALHDMLAKYLPVKELHESIPHQLMEKLGF
jgi:hypothetical protein